ncbi:MAG: SDR family NAD(P)-dependent oxidoreductase [Caulobacterales bacterium]|jgi:NAD(P)-dependent dehydrogenase (short-subunit alcohol dehydrogenase family)
MPKTMTDAEARNPTDPFGLSGARVLITGASSGLGAHFASALAQAGARVALAARRSDRIEALAQEITKTGGSAVAIGLDVQDEASIIAGFDAAQAGLGGPMDVVVNNAGMNSQGAAVDLDIAAFDQLIAVNVRGVFLCAREGARRMMQAGVKSTGRGRVINIASIGAHTVLPGLSAYCTSKAAVAMMTKSLAREWARQGISVNAICPGYVETEINAEWLSQEGGQRMVNGFPRKRLMRAGDLDHTLLFLAGAHSAYVTGAVITIDDGQSL